MDKPPEEDEDEDTTDEGDIHPTTEEPHTEPPHTDPATTATLPSAQKTCALPLVPAEEISYKNGYRLGEIGKRSCDPGLFLVNIKEVDK